MAKYKDAIINKITVCGKEYKLPMSITLTAEDQECASGAGEDEANTLFSIVLLKLFCKLYEDGDYDEWS